MATEENGNIEFISDSLVATDSNDSFGKVSGRNNLNEVVKIGSRSPNDVSEDENSTLTGKYSGNNDSDLLDIVNLHISEEYLEESSFSDLVDIILDKGDDSGEGGSKTPRNESKSLEDHEKIPHTVHEEQVNSTESDHSVADTADSSQIIDSGLQSVINSEDILQDIESVINADYSFTGAHGGKDINENLYEKLNNVPDHSNGENFSGTIISEESENMKDMSQNLYLQKSSDEDKGEEEGTTSYLDSDLQVDGEAGTDVDDKASEMVVLEFNEDQINSWDDVQGDDSELIEHGQRGRPKRITPKRPAAPCSIKPKTSQSSSQLPLTGTQASSQLSFCNPPVNKHPSIQSQTRNIPPSSMQGLGFVQRFPVIVQSDLNSAAPVRLQICTPGIESQTSDANVLSSQVEKGQMSSPSKGDRDKVMSSSSSEKNSLESDNQRTSTETGAGRPVKRQESCMSQFSSVQLDGPPEPKPNTFSVSDNLSFVNQSTVAFTSQADMRPFVGLEMQGAVHQPANSSQYFINTQCPQVQPLMQATTVPSCNIYSHSQRASTDSTLSDMQSFQPHLPDGRAGVFQMPSSTDIPMSQNIPDSSHSSLGMQSAQTVNFTNNQYEVQGPPGSFGLPRGNSASLRNGHFSVRSSVSSMSAQRVMPNMNFQGSNKPPSFPTMSQQHITNSSHPGQKSVTTQPYSVSAPKASGQGPNQAHRGSARMQRLQKLVAQQKSQSSRNVPGQKKEVQTTSSPSVSSAVSDRYSNGREEFLNGMIVLSPPAGIENMQALSSPVNPNLREDQLYALNFSPGTDPDASALLEPHMQRRQLGSSRPRSRSKKGTGIPVPFETPTSRVESWIRNNPNPNLTPDLDSGTFDPSDNSLLQNPSLPVVACSVFSDKQRMEAVSGQPTEIMGLFGQPMLVVPESNPPKQKKDRTKDKIKNGIRNRNGAAALPSATSCSKEAQNKSSLHYPGALQHMATGSIQSPSASSNNFSMEEMEKSHYDSIESSLHEILSKMDQKPNFSDEKAQADFEIQQLMNQKSIEKFLANHSSSSDSGQKLPSLEQFLSSDELFNFITKDPEQSVSHNLDSTNASKTQSDFKQPSFDPATYITPAMAASLEKKKTEKGQTSLDNYLGKAAHNISSQAKPQTNISPLEMNDSWKQTPLEDLEDVIVEPLCLNPCTQQEHTNMAPMKESVGGAGRDRKNKRPGPSLSVTDNSKGNIYTVQSSEEIPGNYVSKTNLLASRECGRVQQGNVTRKSGSKKGQYVFHTETTQILSNPHRPHGTMAQSQTPQVSSYQGLFHVPNCMHAQSYPLPQQQCGNSETLLSTNPVAIPLDQKYGSDIEMQQSSFENCPTVGLEKSVSENLHVDQFDILHLANETGIGQMHQQNVTLPNQMAPQPISSSSSAFNDAIFRKPYGIPVSQHMPQQNNYLQPDYMASQPSMGGDSDVSMYSECSLQSNPKSSEKENADLKMQHSPYYQTISNADVLRETRIPQAQLSKRTPMTHQKPILMQAGVDQNIQQQSVEQPVAHPPFTAQMCSSQTNFGQKPCIFTSPAVHLQQTSSVKHPSSFSNIQQPLTQEQLNLLCQKHPEVLHLLRQHTLPSSQANTGISQSVQVNPTHPQMSQRQSVAMQPAWIGSRQPAPYQTPEAARRPDYAGNAMFPVTKGNLSSTESQLQNYLHGGFPSLGLYDFDEELPNLSSVGGQCQSLEKKDTSVASMKEDEPGGADFVIEGSSYGSDENLFNFKPDRDGETCLHLLCDMPRDRRETLLSLPGFHQALNLLNTSQETALFIAVKCNDLEVVKFLVSQGADVNINCISSAKSFRAEMVHQTALHEAVEMGCLDIVVALLKSPKSDVDAGRRGSGMTPLMLALETHGRANRKNIILTLIQNKASLTVRDKIQGRTPLMYAIQSRDVSLVEDILHTVGAERARSLVTVSAKKGLTCLHFAAELRMSSVEKQKLLRCIIVAGGDASVKNSEGETARDWAKKDITEVLQNLAKLSKP